MATIKNIIFDLGGVIINLRNEKEWLENYMITLLGEDGLDSVVEKKCFEEFECGKFSIEKFHQNLEITSKRKFTLESLKFAWNGRLKDIPQERIDLLYKLKENYNLYLLSNTNQIHIDFVLEYIHQRFGVVVFDAVFEKCFYSYEMKMAKPGRAIYEAVLNSANLKAKETLFIDDSHQNLDQPNEIGIATIHFKSDEQFRKELSTLSIT